MKTFRLLTLMLTLFFAADLMAVQWQTDYDKALQDARASNKPIVLFFTGSDWCTWCKRLEKEALSTQEFNQKAGDAFIFVELDYPMSFSLPAGVQTQNQKLKSKYQIDGYPTVIVINADEKVLLRTGYQAGGGANYANMLLQSVKK